MTSIIAATDRIGKRVRVNSLSIDMVHDMWDFQKYTYAVVEMDDKLKALIEVNVTFRGNKVSYN